MMAFVGSGTSCALGGPRWKKLVQEIHKAANGDTGPKNLSDDNSTYLSILDEAVLRLGESEEYQNCLNSLFNGNAIKATYEDHNPIRALLELDINRFCTTNYDNAIEDTIAARKELPSNPYRPQRPTKPFSGLSEGDLEQQIRFAAARPRNYTSTEGAKVWHIHGHYSKPKSLVLTQTHYDQLYRASGANFDSTFTRQLLKVALGSSPVLFVGYSMSDQDLLDILRIQRIDHRHYDGLQPLFGIFEREEDDAVEERIRRDMWAKYNLARISYRRDYCAKHGNSKTEMASSCGKCISIRDAYLAAGYEESGDNALIVPPALCAEHAVEQATEAEKAKDCGACNVAHGKSVTHVLRSLQTDAADKDRRFRMQYVRPPANAPVPFEPTTFKPTNVHQLSWARPHAYRTTGADPALTATGWPPLTPIVGRAGTARSLCAELFCYLASRPVLRAASDSIADAKAASLAESTSITISDDADDSETTETNDEMGDEITISDDDNNGYDIMRWDLAESGDVTSLSEVIVKFCLRSGSALELPQIKHYGYRSAFQLLARSKVVVLIEGIEHLLWPESEAPAASALAHRLLKEISGYASRPDPTLGRIVLTTEQVPPQLETPLRNPFIAANHAASKPPTGYLMHDLGPRRQTFVVPPVPAWYAKLHVRDYVKHDAPPALKRHPDFEFGPVEDLVGQLRGAGQVLKLALQWMERSLENPQSVGVSDDLLTPAVLLRDLVADLHGNPGVRRDKVFAKLAFSQSAEYRMLLSAMALAFAPMSERTAKLVVSELAEVDRKVRNGDDDSEVVGGAKATATDAVGAKVEAGDRSGPFETAWDELVKCGVLCESTLQGGAFVVNDFARRQVLNQAQYSTGSAGRSHRPLTGTTAPGPAITAGSLGATLALHAVNVLIENAHENVKAFEDKNRTTAIREEARDVANKDLRAALGFIRSRFEARSASPTVKVNDVLARELTIVNLSRRLAPDSWRVSRDKAAQQPTQKESTFTLGELGWLYNDIAIGMYATGRMDQAEAMYSRGHEIHRLLSVRIGDETYQAQSRLHFAHLAIARADLTLAGFYLDKTEELAHDLPERHRQDFVTRVSGYRGIIAHLQDDRGLAVRYFMQALEDYIPDVKPEFINRRAVAKFLIHFAYLKLDVGNEPNECALYLSEAKGMAEGAYGVDLAVLARIGEANVHRRAKEFSSANRVLRRARAIAEGADLRRIMVEVELQRAQLDLAAGQHDRAWVTATKMLDGATSAGLLLRQTRAIELLGDIAHARGRPSEAKACYTVALDRAERQQYWRRANSCRRRLADLGYAPIPATPSTPSPPIIDDPDTLIDLSDSPEDPQIDDSSHGSSQRGSF